MVNDEEVAAFYKENQSRFTRPARRRGAIIRLSVPSQASDEKRNGAVIPVIGNLDVDPELEVALG